MRGVLPPPPCDRKSHQINVAETAALQPRPGTPGSQTPGGRTSAAGPGSSGRCRPPAPAGFAPIPASCGSPASTSARNADTFQPAIHVELFHQAQPVGHHALVGLPALPGDKLEQRAGLLTTTEEEVEKLVDEGVVRWQGKARDNTVPATRQETPLISALRLPARSIHSDEQGAGPHIPAPECRQTRRRTGPGSPGRTSRGTRAGRKPGRTGQNGGAGRNSHLRRAAGS